VMVISFSSRQSSQLAYPFVPSLVMAGLVPAIHDLVCRTVEIRGCSALRPGMTRTLYEEQRRIFGLRKGL